MKLFQYKIIALSLLCCTIDQQASQFRQLSDDDAEEYVMEEMHCAIRAVDLSFVDRKMSVSEQLELVDKAITWRYHALGDDEVIYDAVLAAKRLYETVSKAKKRNHVIEVLVSQAIVALLQGQAELGQKYLVQVYEIRNKKPEKRPVGLGLIESLAVEDL